MRRKNIVKNFVLWTVVVNVFFLSSSTIANGVSTSVSSSDIKALSIYTAHQEDLNLQNYAVLEINGGLSGPCTSGVFVNVEDNPATYSMLLAGVLSNKSMAMVYDNEKFGPWGDSSWCALLTLGVSP
ncbi:MAG: hypothetical protein KUG79_14015 [Pseudomonadales bacterium]|nr:hypothetical protein [Pseudomonadales bacterium]